MDCFPHFFPIEELRAELILGEKDVLCQEIVQTASIHQEWVSIFQENPDQRLAGEKEESAGASFGKNV